MVSTAQQAELSIRFSGKGLNSPAPTPLLESAITHTVHRDVCLLLVIVIQPPPALYTTGKGALLFQILEIFLRRSHYVAQTGLKLRSACLCLPIAETTSLCSKSFSNLEVFKALPAPPTASSKPKVRSKDISQLCSVTKFVCKHDIPVLKSQILGDGDRRISSLRQA